VVIALRQDAKYFRYQMMAAERQKRSTLAPTHHAAAKLLPLLSKRHTTSWDVAGRRK